MSDAPHRDCPVCGSPDRRVVFRQEFAAVEQATPITGYDVAVCERCGAAYADGIPGQAAFDRYYREMSKYEYAQRGGEESEYDARRLAVIADVVAPRLPSRDARVLDVGCASGRLLANLRERGFPNVTGLDPSPACAATAARLYSIPVRTTTLAGIAASGERFDVVIMVGVLEHLRDLESAFAQVRALLEPSGLFYVEVPDVTAFADWPNAPYQDFSTEHINFFSPVSLRNLMRRHGFAEAFLEQNHREQSYRTVMSNISAFYRREEEMPQHIEFDADTALGLDRYLAACAADERRLHEKIDAVVDAKQPILVWGVGTHTSRLMATSRLAEADIVAFVESNSRYHGKLLHGRPIVAPEALRERREPVLISSRVFQQEIADQIRTALGCANELILLYNV
ncbi:MAG TPA: methyltransferase domain-containing protein [Vicinamibacterales bacterium]|nr:methyltransferase domain-containing protein [Vicinamibacterales bacterium]